MKHEEKKEERLGSGFVLVIERDFEHWENIGNVTESEMFRSWKVKQKEMKEKEKRKEKEKEKEKEKTVAQWPSAYVVPGAGNVVAAEQFGTILVPLHRSIPRRRWP